MRNLNAITRCVVGGDVPSCTARGLDLGAHAAYHAAYHFIGERALSLVRVRVRARVRARARLRLWMSLSMSLSLSLSLSPSLSLSSFGLSFSHSFSLSQALALALALAFTPNPADYYSVDLVPLLSEKSSEYAGHNGPLAGMWTWSAHSTALTLAP